MTTSPEGGDEGALVLVPPSPVPAVPAERAGNVVPVAPEVAAELDERAAAFVGEVVELDTRSPGFTTKLASVHALGNKEIRESASVSNRLLDKPGKAMAGAGGPGEKVSSSLVELRRTVEDLDPSGQDLFAPRKLLGMIPFGNRLRDYFAKYASSQSQLNAIVNALYRGQDELRKDNAAIEQEKQNLWKAMDRLRRYAYLADGLDARLSARIEQIGAADPERARTLREDVLFYVRQKHQDLLTQLAVNAQGYLALDLVRKNNLELIKGVDRATTTTVAALRTAVIAAQALADQKLVLDQVAALNSTTGALIESTSQLLRQQAGQVHQQAASASVPLDALQRAFANIYATIDAIDTYKVAALDTMRATVDALSVEVDKAAKYLERAEPGAPGAPGDVLSLPAGS